jgi:chemotaxis protein CheY-P-specific phosphatase CheC
MKARERIDKIMAQCQKKIQDEVSALLGKEVALGEVQTALLDKEAYFEELSGKVVLAHLQFEGEIEGKGAIVVSIKDAIQIGGTLIMLPDSELQLSAADENYSEELQDSYGEIANIISGSLTSTFEEQHPKNFRLVRTEQEIVIPTKVDPESDSPIPPGEYHRSSFSMKMGGVEMGNLDLLLAAEPLGLVETAASPQPEEETASPSPEPQQSAQTESEVQEAVEQTPVEDKPATPAPEPGLTKKQLEKQKKLIDGLLKTCADKVGEEVTALVGDQLKLKDVHHDIYTKESLLEIPQGKQALTKMDIRGGATGAPSEACLIVKLTAAIHMGGTLIMLPDSELDETVRNEDFGEDAQDAYGEIANIIAGVYTAVFEEQYKKKLGFVRTTTETMIPIKVDPDSDDAFINQAYYATSGEIVFDDKEMGGYLIAFPAGVLDLEGLLADDEPEETVAASAPSAREQGGAREKEGTQQGTVAATGGTSGGQAQTGPLRPPGDPPDVLLFSDDPDESARIAGALRELGYLAKELAFKSSVAANMNNHIRLVFLVMKEVSEQGFGVAIKISSAGYQVPLVVAGPAWTRTLVIKAVKYGADDILLTPAGVPDVQEKIEMNLGKIAA